MGKVMLVDDHPLFVEGLQYLLKTHGIKVIGIAKNGKEALIKARKLKPDIILMDIFMPECNGIEAIKLIKAEMPKINIVMLTSSEEDDNLFEAIRLGASGYLLKSLNGEELVSMIRDLEKGEAVISPSLAGKLLREMRRINPVVDINLKNKLPKEMSLTERQMEVLELVSNGLTYKEVGDILGLTERTVKYHMKRILELLHLENRAQVIAYAARLGLDKS